MQGHDVKTVVAPLMGFAFLIGVTVELSSAQESPSAKALLERFKSTEFE